MNSFVRYRDGVTLDLPALTGIRRLSALDTVRARIALAVELGLLAPGERLPSNADIARALDVGEITVRRALVSLCEDGVLERRRGRAGGTLVADPPPQGRVQEMAVYTDAATEVHELIDHRLALECGLVHLASLRRDDTQLRHLRELVEKMDKALSWAEFHDLDAEFHRSAAAASGLASTSKRYADVLGELYGYYLPYPVEFLRESNREHAALVEALTRQDPAAAVELTCRHVEALHKTMFVGLTP
ncbi:MAG: GntR family transcriptional regulator, transcriptional repressor for pyruvate dehydrogenase complex [Actinomycetota bacterium]|nr:GntR family transcriptional regulator, transcriptional repressor for pyruvate dehydrogenase complex [Actinomycetota bacterium]